MFHPNTVSLVRRPVDIKSLLRHVTTGATKEEGKKKKGEEKEEEKEEKEKEEEKKEEVEEEVEEEEEDGNNVSKRHLCVHSSHASLSQSCLRF